METADVSQLFFFPRCLGGCAPVVSAVSKKPKPACWENNDDDDDGEVVLQQSSKPH